MKKILLFIILFMCFEWMVHASDSTIYQDDRVYELMDGIWYSTGGTSRFEVDEDVIVVKYKSTVDSTQKDSVNDALNVEFINHELFGYYALLILDESSPFDN